MAFDKNITVVKIGGNVIDNEAALERFVADFAQLPSPKILIHGGGKLATRLAEKLEIPTTMIEGRRVTDAATLDVVTMVYAGLINKQVVAKLQAAGCNALGFSGADGNMIPAVKRNPEPLDYGFVGDIESSKINTSLLASLLQSGVTPVFCAITHDGRGSLLNSNADSVASAVAVAAATIAPTDLVFCFEKQGVLRDVEDDSSVISLITKSDYPALRNEGIISKGMIPKIDNAFRAIEQGVASVTIKHSECVANPAAGSTIK
jgi:acetylglutamate kinase